MAALLFSLLAECRGPELFPKSKTEPGVFGVLEPEPNAAKAPDPSPNAEEALGVDGAALGVLSGVTPLRAFNFPWYEESPPTYLRGV